MNHTTTNLTPDFLAALCARTFPDRPNQQLAEITPLNSRQHEVVGFELWWYTAEGITMCEALIVRRYVSQLSWWRADDRGKAQREVTVMSWLGEAGFPVPKVYTREFGALGDVVLFSRLPSDDIFLGARSLADTIRPYILPFAGALARLHSMVPSDEVRRVIPRVTLPSAMANLTALAAQIDDEELTAAVDQAMNQVFDVPETQPVVIHGDYHFHNALMHRGEISGIIDWEYSALGDPRWDVANVYVQLVDFGAADAADAFLNAYLEMTGQVFEGPPLYNVVAALQQWAMSEWMVRQEEQGNPLTFGLAESLVILRDVHRRRALQTLQLLD